MKHNPVATEEQVKVCLLLDNIRSVHNVGSIFRTADTIGIKKIYCADTTPTPIDRFGRKRSDFAKVSLGAENSLEWEHIIDAVKFLKKFKKENPETRIIALEQSEKSIDYKKIVLKNESALIILGNEVDGVNPKLLELCDTIAEIPMRGKKESLNVSISAGIFLFRLLDE
jgi:tRNA G18 (ribose-2'-O)-methylase SpoU